MFGGNGGSSGSNAMSFPSGNDDGGFGDFQANAAASSSSPAVNMQSDTNPTNMTQQTINIQNLY